VSLISLIEFYSRKKPLEFLDWSDGSIKDETVNVREAEFGDITCKRQNLNGISF